VAFERAGETADVVVQRLQGDQLDLADGAGAGEFLRAHDVAELLRQLGHRGEVLRRLARGVAAEPRQPLDHIGRIADLAELAVADDGDSRLDLARHRIVDRGLHHAVELGRVVGLAPFGFAQDMLVAREQQRHELRAARQAPDMSGLDHAGRYFRYAKLPQGRKNSYLAGASPNRSAN
jgi:hypothetical protein